MFDILFKFLSSLANTALPVLGSFRALKQNDVLLIRLWLMYWVVVSIQLTVESYLGIFLFFVPFFQFFRFLFTLWMVLPQTQGATQIYISYVDPFLTEHEGEIDKSIAKIHYKFYTLFTEYLAKLLFYAKEYALHIATGSPVHDLPAIEQQTPQMFFQQQSQSQSQYQSSSSNDNTRANVTAAATAIVSSGASAKISSFFSSSSKQPDRDNSAGAIFSKIFKSSSSSSPFSDSASQRPPINGLQNPQQDFQPAYLDSFFAKFKNPPSLAMDQPQGSSSSQPATQPPPPSSSSRPGSRDTAPSSLDAQSGGAQSAFSYDYWNSTIESIARSGVAAIQTGLYLPKVTPEVYKAQLNTFTPHASNAEFDAVSSGASVYSAPATLRSRALGAPLTPLASSSSSISTRSSISSTSSRRDTEGNLAPPPPAGTTAFSRQQNRNSSSSLSVSDMDFDFVRYSEYDDTHVPRGNAGSSDNNNLSESMSIGPQSNADVTSSLLGSPPPPYSEILPDANAPLLQPPPARRSSSWFGWRRNSGSS